MSAYGDTLAADARLKILQLLRKAGEAPLNHELLQLALLSMSIRMTAAQVRAELQYLSEVGTVILQNVGPLLVAELTERGSDVARGLSVVTGIARHVPGTGQ